MAASITPQGSAQPYRRYHRRSSADALQKGYRRMAQERLPEAIRKGSLALRRQSGPVPADFPQAGGTKALVMCSRAQKVVRDVERSFVLENGVDNGRSLVQLARRALDETESPA